VRERLGECAKERDVEGVLEFVRERYTEGVSERDREGV